MINKILRGKIRAIPIVVALFIAVSAVLTGCAAAEEKGMKYLGSFLSSDVYLYLDENVSSAEFSSIKKKCEDKIDEYEDAFSLSSFGALTAFNSAKSGQKTEVSPLCYNLFKRAVEISEETCGAFDPTVYPLVDLWGFSFRFDSPLDMRMNQKAPFTAADILNTYEEQQLASLFRIYGELNDARQLARKIAKARESQKIETTGQLIELAKPKLGKEQEKKYWAKVFQSLRIEVNNEMRALKELLVQANELLKPDGRIAVITYHSLEDRMVKNFFRSGNFDGEAEKDFYGNIISPLEAVNNKVITPSEEEMQQNPRSRSAKLRIARKKQVKG